MSVKQQLSEALSSLPESSSLEEAFNRLYSAFPEKLPRESVSLAREGRVPGLHPGAFATSEDFDEPLPDELWAGTP